MAFEGMGQSSFLNGLASSAGNIVDRVFGDVLGTLGLGTDRFRSLFDQSESGNNGVLQYDDQPTDRRQWAMPKDRSSPDYFFLLSYDGRIVQIPFNINPSSETIDEPQASTTQVTQGGGKLLNSEGAVLKDITIQGTCGLYPGERRQRLPDSGIGSGLEAFKFLQNVFRRYCFLKRYGDLSKGLQLIYVNRRRQESWVVNPKIFRSEDSKDHNFHFYYTIVLETLYPYQGAETKGLVESLFDAIPGFRSIDYVVQRIVEAVDQVNASVGAIGAIVDGFSTTVMQPVIALANSWADVKAGRLPNLAEFKRDRVKILVENMTSVVFALEAAGEDELSQKVKNLRERTRDTLLLDSFYDSSPQSNANLVATTQGQQIQNFRDGNGVSVSPEEAAAAGAASAPPDASEVMGGVQTSLNAIPGTATAQRAAIADAAKNTISVSSVGSAVLDGANRYQMIRTVAPDLDPLTVLPPSTESFGSELNWNASWNQALRNIDPANSDYRIARVNLEDDIQTLAYRLLGDHARWPELVLLNNLKYPYLADPDYIADNSLTNVAAYGSTILYPTPKRQTVQRARVWRNENEFSVRLSPAERALGSDIKINPDTGDVEWTANDLSLIYGVDNYAQFVRKRIVTRRGTLRRSLRLGFSQIVGTSQGVSESVIRSEGQGLLFGDERTVSNDVIETVASAGVIAIKMVATVRDIQDPILLTENL